MKRIYLPVAMLLLFASCGGREKSVAEKTPGLVIGGEDAGASPSSIYQMPTPNELFSLVRELAGEGHKRLLNPTTNADRYVSRMSRAVNFGVYSTDLVYASSFKLNVEVARYYLTTKKLAEELGISSAFTDADFIRLEQNLTRGDSLELISNNAYLKAYEKLEEEQMGSTLALVLAGGWVESMHLLISQVDAFGQSTAFTDRIAEQKVSLEHLLFIMDMYQDDADVAMVKDKLLVIRDVYDRMNVRHMPAPARHTTGRLILGDDVDIDLTEETYNELMTAVRALREELIKSEDAQKI
jgi:hypothetical protein